jgi:hypothetical protein
MDHINRHACSSLYPYGHKPVGLLETLANLAQNGINEIDSCEALRAYNFTLKGVILNSSIKDLSKALSGRVQNGIDEINAAKA